VADATRPARTTLITAYGLHSKRRRRYSIVDRQKRRLAIPFLLPALGLYVGFMLYPAFTTFYVALTDWDGVSAHLPYVGLRNFRDLAKDDTFRSTIGHTVLFTVLGAAILFPLAIFFAYVTHDRPFGKFFRFLILAPLALSVTTSALLWKFALDPNFGLVQKGFKAVGLDGLAHQQWLGDTRTAMLMIVLATIWNGVGLWMTLFAAAIERVPKDLLDAALVDGATGFRTFRHVVWPLIWEVTRTLLILWIIQGLQAFAFIIAMTNGGPLGSTQVIGTYLYGVAFQDGRFGYGSAIAVVLFIAILIVALVSFRLTRRESEQY
jgi:raffinose/stachyose/melibiose transport system permease protein/N-acetylglucosamine transport system permease protein